MVLLCVCVEESMNPDAKLETETENGNAGHIPEHLDSHVYHPIVALKIALAVSSQYFFKTQISRLVKLWFMISKHLRNRSGWVSFTKEGLFGDLL